ncbi:hypothetical protein IE981_15075 [Klebsiella pneumoniae]|nr:hypothetical protein [Klebsiella pneumoniae]
MSPQIVLRVSSLVSVFGLAGAGIGIGIVPELPVEVVSLRLFIFLWLMLATVTKSLFHQSRKILRK